MDFCLDKPLTFSLWSSFGVTQVFNITEFLKITKIFFFLIYILLSYFCCCWHYIVSEVGYRAFSALALTAPLDECKIPARIHCALLSPQWSQTVSSESSCTQTSCLRRGSSLFEYPLLLAIVLWNLAFCFI